ncbi:MAG: hypothetical protein ABIR71_08940 [Chthoniobacterales bacterium]
MSGLLEDFIRQFAGGAPADESATQYHDRFVSTDENDREFENEAYHEGAAEYLAQMPDDQFQGAARTAIAQTPPQERENLLGDLLRGLTGGGAAGGVLGALGGAGGLGDIAKMLGLGSSDPKRMDDNDAAKLMNYARRERPEVMRRTVQEKPWFVKALGNPVVMGALTMAATRLLRSRLRR